MRAPRNQKEAIVRMRRGHEAAAEKQRELMATEGPKPERAIAELLSALHAMSLMGLWPGPRDPASERGVEEVRRRWARIQKRARRAHSR